MSSTEEQKPRDTSGTWVRMVDPDFDPEEEKQLDQKFDSVWQPSWAGESRCWRLFVRGAVIGLAVALLWLTSLTLATTIAGIYVAAPSYDEAVNEWSFAAQIASQEQANAGECVVREVATCHIVLNKTYQILLQQSADRSKQNDLVVSTEADQAAFCQKSWDGSLLATSNLLKKMIFNSTIYSNGTVGANCSQEDVTNLRSLLGDVSQQKSDVYLKNVQYTRDSGSFLSSAADSAANRTKYDDWYIQYKFGFLTNWSLDLPNVSTPYIGNITANLDGIDAPVDALIGCIGLNGTCDFPVNAKEAYNAMKASIDNKFGDIKLNYELWLQDLQSFNDTVWQYVSEASSMIGTIKGTYDTIDKLANTLKISLPVTVFPDYTFITNLPKPPALPDDLDIPTPDMQYEEVKDTLAAIMPAFANVKNNVANTMQKWKNAINDSLYFPDLGFSIPNYFADYDPPPIVVDTSGFNLATTNFLEQSRVSLDGFDSLGNYSFNPNASKYDFQAIIKKLPAFSSYSIMSSPFSGEFDFYSIFSSIGNVMFLLISADIIYRVFNSVAIVRKYTRMSELGLPVIDIREFEASKQSTNPTLAMYQLCTSPLILVIILLVVALMILGALIALYVPLYTSYQDGCVKSNNGTLITRNAYAFAYNYAAADANEQTGDGLSKYDKQRTEYCNAATQQFNERQQTSQDDLAKIRQNYDNTATDLDLFQRCILPSALPSNDVWLNLTNYPSPYTNASLTARLQCDKPGVYVTSGITDGSFDCTQLPPCNLTCSGPDKDALMAVTYDSGCTSEWAFHAGLFRALLGLLVFVCINISRTLLMTAVIRLCWRQLTSKGFEFQGTCTKMGTAEGLEARLKVAVEKAIKSYERGALLMLVGAVLIHIPYLVVLNKFGNIQNHQ